MMALNATEDPRTISERMQQNTAQKRTQAYGVPCLFCYKDIQDAITSDYGGSRRTIMKNLLNGKPPSRANANIWRDVEQFESIVPAIMTHTRIISSGIQP